MSDRPHLSIGEVLALLQGEFPDVTISKIRFLESQGLLEPERTPSGYRKFYDVDLARLRWILTQQRDHFLPLKVIKDRLEAGPLDLEPLEPGDGSVRPEVTAAADPAGGGEPGGDQPVDAGGADPVIPTVVTDGEVEPAAGNGSLGAPISQSLFPDVAEPESADPGTVDPGTGGDTDAPVEPGSRGPGPGALPEWSGLTGRDHAEPVARRSSRHGTRPARYEPEPMARSGEADGVDGAVVVPAPDEGADGRADEGPGDGVGDVVEPVDAPGDAFDAEVQLTRDELGSRTGLDDAELGELERFGLLVGRHVGDEVLYDADELAVAELAARFRQHGIEARHLRLYRSAADRELALFQQVVAPFLPKRGRGDGTRAAELLAELGQLGDEVRRVLFRKASRDYLGGD